MTTAEAESLYPITLEVDYPERQSRWKTLLRLFLAIPVLLFAMIVAGGGLSYLRSAHWSGQAGPFSSYTLGLGATSIMVAIWIAIVFRGLIPRWLFNFQVALMRFQTRAYGYLALLTDTYPPFEGDHPIRFEVQYPEKPSRWKVLIWKFVTALPHFVVLAFLSIGVFFAVVGAWFAILFTGRYPKGLHGYVVGVARWGLRVQGYLLSLTDEFPPFSLSADAGPSGKDSYVICSIIGGLMAVAMVGLGVTGIVIGRQADRQSVSYAALKTGQGGVTFRFAWENISLLSATDPANSAISALSPREGKRFVSFGLQLTNKHDSEPLNIFGRRIFDGSINLRQSDLRLKDSNGKWHDAQLVIGGGSVAPVKVSKNTSVQVTVLFEIDEQAQPTELRYRSPPSETRAVIWELK